MCSGTTSAYNGNDTCVLWNDIGVFRNDNYVLRDDIGVHGNTKISAQINFEFSCEIFL